MENIDKKEKLFNLFGIKNESELKKIKVDESYIALLESRINEGLIDAYNKESIADLKGLNKKEQSLIIDIFSLLKEKLLEDQTDTEYNTLKYVLFYLQKMNQVEELKYILAYMAKSNTQIPINEYIFNEDKQYIFEGILYSAMSLYVSGNASRSKVTESHKKWEKDIEAKKEEQLSRTQELISFRHQALRELGYTSINDDNAKEVFEKIAEIMSSKF